jgi:hypothetical protein
MNDLNDTTGTTDEIDMFGGPKGARYIPPELEREAISLSGQPGLTLRQPPRDPPKRRRGTALQLHNFTFRLHMDDAERFIRWCESERIAYREGFQRLVAMIGEGDSR